MKDMSGCLCRQLWARANVLGLALDLIPCIALFEAEVRIEGN